MSIVVSVHRNDNDRREPRGERASPRAPGLAEDSPLTLESTTEGRQQWAHLLVDLLELIEETYEHGLNQFLPSDQLFAMLVTRMRSVLSQAAGIASDRPVGTSRPWRSQGERQHGYVVGYEPPDRGQDAAGSHR